MNKDNTIITVEDRLYIATLMMKIIPKSTNEFSENELKFLNDMKKSIRENFNVYFNIKEVPPEIITKIVFDSIRVQLKECYKEHYKRIKDLFRNHGSSTTFQKRVIDVNQLLHEELVKISSFSLLINPMKNNNFIESLESSSPFEEENIFKATYLPVELIDLLIPPIEIIIKEISTIQTISPDRLSYINTQKIIEHYGHKIMAERSIGKANKYSNDSVLFPEITLSASEQEKFDDFMKTGMLINSAISEARHEVKSVINSLILDSHSY